MTLSPWINDRAGFRESPTGFCSYLSLSVRVLNLYTWAWNHIFRDRYRLDSIDLLAVIHLYIELESAAAATAAK